METLMTHIQPFLGWLLNATLVGSLIVCLILLIQKTLGGKLGPRWSHALWLVLLVRMVLPWAPSSRLSLSNLIPSWDRQTQSQQSIETVPVQQTALPMQLDESTEAPPDFQSQTEAAVEKPVDITRPVVTETQAQSGPWLVSFRRLLPIIWLAGAAVIGVYLIVSDLALWRIVKRDRPLVNQPMLELFEECKAQMGIQSLVAVVPSEKVRSPGLFGFVRPRLLLPREMLDTATREEMRYVFLHELAHLKRHDIYLGWLTSLLQVLHWFNPLIWFAFYRMRADRELACDALVLTRTGHDKSQEYGGAILGLVRRFSRLRPLPAMAGIMESKSQLKRRIAMITQFKHNSYRFSPLAAVLIIILACISLPNARRTKASETSAPSVGMTVRKVWEGQDVDNCGEISPDGKYLSYVDWGTGDLAVYEIATGKKRHLTNKGPWKESDEFADFNRWSPDSRQIVYAWYNQNRKESGELRVIDTDGSAEPRILFSDESYQWISPCDWSKDGKLILTWPQKKDGSELAVISVADGSIRVLKEFAKGRFNNAIFSPEGDDIVYDDLNGDIIMLSVKSGKERTLVEHPANDSVLGWGADGKYLLFTSDRSGFPDIWAVKVDAGKALDDPWLVKSGMGVDPPRALGTTTAGLFYYSTFPRQTDIYVTEIDPGSGNVVSQPREAINYFVGSNATPDYSPDGKYMAYVRKSGPVGNLLCIRSLETGEERSFRPSGLDVFGFPRWSHDGRSLLVIATGGTNIRTKNGEMGLYTVNAQTGESELIVKTQIPQRLHDHAWGTDEKSVVFVRSTNLEDVNSYTNTEIVQRVIAGGIETSLLSGTLEDIYSISRSPHGRWLAVLGKHKRRNLRVIPLTGGETRVVCTFEQGDYVDIDHAWSADGKYILLPQLHEPQGNRKKWDLCRIAVEDGKSQNLGLEMLGFRSLSMHPDGRHIAFSSQAANNKPKTIWVMENFLPTAAVARSANQTNFKKIRIPTQPGGGVLSADGQRLAYISEGSLWTVPVHGKVSPDIAGEPVRLTEPMGAWDVASMLAWSADGKWIAFNVSDEKEDAIYVIASSGGEPGRVAVEPRLRNSVYNYRLSLSPDGRVVAFSSRYIDESGAEPPEEPGLPPSVRGFFIYTVPVAGGQVKRLTDSSSGEPVFSPDGKMIAFVKYHISEGGQLYGSVWVVPAVGGNPVQVSEPDPKRRVGGPVWSPYGRMIAYTARTESERKEVFVVPVSETGRALASPTKIRLPLNTLDFLAGWTRDNRIGVFLHEPGSWAIHTVPASGGQAVQVTPSGSAAHPQWSPDGQRIYFRWDGGEMASVPSGGGQLSKGPVNSGETFYLIYPGCGNAVSPDGKEIVFCAGKRISPENKEPYWEVNIYTIPVEGGEPRKIAQDGRYPCWSPDGKSIAFIRTYRRPVKRESGWNIYVVPSKGGDVRQLTSDSDDVRRTHIDFSPDGKSIAYFAKDKTLRVIPVQGGKPRVVATAEELRNHDAVAFSPDGGKLVYSSKGAIWAVSSDGGEPEEIRTGLDEKAGHVSFSPDGRKLAFTAMSAGEEDLYLIENFLPTTAVAESEPMTTVRKIESDWGTFASLSPDGRYLCDVDWDTENLAVLELATGKIRRLTDNSSDSPCYPLDSAISPDNRQVAYLWWNHDARTSSLRVVGLDGEGDRILCEGKYPMPRAWSSDGEKILTIISQNDVQQMVWISALDGSIQRIISFDGESLGYPGKFDISPDGRFIAYDRPHDKESSTRNIFVFDLNKNVETSLVEHPADDRLLGWTPDGKSVLFASNRTSSWDAWLMQVVDGKPKGFPILTKHGIGNVRPIGFTPYGSYYYAYEQLLEDVFAARLDLETGEVLSEPVPIRQTGATDCHDFSPEGEYQAYCERRPDDSRVIHIRTLATGQERTLAENLPYIRWLRWSLDGRSLLIDGARREDSQGVIYKIDVRTGERTELVRSETEVLIRPEMSPDGKTLYFARNNPRSRVMRLIARNVQSGGEEELL